METKIDHRRWAVLGPAILVIAALRFASSILGATTTTTILVFVLSAMAGELFNPFLFFPFALYPMFLFLWFPPLGGSIFFFKKLIVIYF